MKVILSEFTPVKVFVNLDMDKMQKLEKNTLEELAVEVSTRYRKVPRKKNKIEMFLGAKTGQEQTIFSFDILFYGTFETEEELTTEKISEDTGLKCAIQLYPYLRETLTDLIKKFPLGPDALLPVAFESFLNPEFKKISSAKSKTPQSAKTKK